MKLTIELAELIGYWKMRRTFRSVGITGDLDHQQEFVKLVLRNKLVPPEAIVSFEKSTWFSHHKIKNFFIGVVMNQNDLFSRKNKLTAAYLRGMYRSNGEGSVINNATFQDRMLIENLGFYTKRVGKKVLIRDVATFHKFIEK